MESLINLGFIRPCFSSPLGGAVWFLLRHFICKTWRRPQTGGKDGRQVSSSSCLIKIVPTLWERAGIPGSGDEEWDSLEVLYERKSVHPPHHSPALTPPRPPPRPPHPWSPFSRPIIAFGFMIVDQQRVSHSGCEVERERDAAQRCLLS